MIAIGNVLVVIFSLANVNIMVLIAIIIVELSFQSTVGSFYFVYMSQVSTEPHFSLAIMGVWLTALLLSFATPAMINSWGVAGCFGTFAVVTGVGVVYLYFNMKDVAGKTFEQCQQLFWPAQYQNEQTLEDGNKALLQEEGDDKGRFLRASINEVYSGQN